MVSCAFPVDFELLPHMNAIPLYLGCGAFSWKVQWKKNISCLKKRKKNHIVKNIVGGENGRLEYGWLKQVVAKISFSNEGKQVGNCG